MCSPAGIIFGQVAVLTLVVTVLGRYSLAQDTSYPARPSNAKHTMCIFVLLFSLRRLVEVVVAVASDSHQQLQQDDTPIITPHICKLLCLLLVVVVCSALHVCLFFCILKVPAASSRATL